MEQTYEINSIQSYENACEGKISVKKYFESLPPGYRFSPQDIELVEQYLMKKVNNEILPPNLIRQVEVYDHVPSNITEQYEPINETEWYFFSSRYKKYPNGSRPDRGTPNGYWKPTGTDKPIPADNPLANKKTLDFLIGKHPKGQPTDWKMHEYTLHPTNIPQPQSSSARNGMMLDACVLCKLYQKKNKNGDDDHHEGNYAATDQQPPSSIVGDDHHDQPPLTSANISSSLSMFQAGNNNDINQLPSLSMFQAGNNNDINQLPSLSMLQAGNNNNNNHLPTGVVASYNIEEASSSNLMMHENNTTKGDKDDFWDNWLRCDDD